MTIPPQMTAPCHAGRQRFRSFHDFSRAADLSRYSVHIGLTILRASCCIDDSPHHNQLTAPQLI